MAPRGARYTTALRGAMPLGVASTDGLGGTWAMPIGTDVGVVTADAASTNPSRRLPPELVHKGLHHFPIFELNRHSYTLVLLSFECIQTRPLVLKCCRREHVPLDRPCVAVYDKARESLLRAPPFVQQLPTHPAHLPCSRYATQDVGIRPSGGEGSVDEEAHRARSVVPPNVGVEARATALAREVQNVLQRFAGQCRCTSPRTTG